MNRPTAMDRLQALSVPEPNTGCWLWMGATTANNKYSRMLFRGKACAAHRVAYMETRGPIGIGLEIDHLCRVTLCVNPEHLEAVTHQVNVLRSNGLTAQNARKTACPAGHLLSGGNLWLEGHRRRCRVCLTEQNRKKVRAYRARRKAS